MSVEEGSRRLGQSMVNFLRNELTSRDLSLENRDNIEIAIECLQSIYNLDTFNNIQRRPLLEMFLQVSNPVSIKDRLRSQSLKEEGNIKMADRQYEGAEQDYSRAIELDRFNAVFYCNRAGARIKLQRYFEATSDCRQALNLNPDYAKAHGRMGQAYALMESHRRAARCFRQALDLEPSNETFRNNLMVAEQQVLVEDPTVSLMSTFVQGILSSILGADGSDSDESGSSALVVSEPQTEEYSESDHLSNSSCDENPSETLSQVDQTSDGNDLEGSSDSEEALIYMRFIFVIAEEEETDQVSGDNRDSMGQTNNANDAEDAPKEPDEETNYTRTLNETPESEDPREQSVAERCEIEEKSESSEDEDSNGVVSNKDDNPSDESLDGPKGEDVLVESKEQIPTQELPSKDTGKKKQDPVFRLSEVTNFFKNFRWSKTNIDKKNDSNETNKNNIMEKDSEKTTQTTENKEMNEEKRTQTPTNKNNCSDSE